MKNIIREAKYIQTNSDKNANKFWFITEFDDFSTKVEFGRVGSTPAVSEKTHESQIQATKFYDSKCKQKEKGKKDEIGYRKLDIISSNGVITKSDFDLVKIVESQIKSNSPDTKALLKYFIEKNIHNITSNTSITYNKQSGLFETELGPVTIESINKAKTILSSIEELINYNETNTKEFATLVGDYLMLIPHNVGRKFIPINVIGTQADINKQNDILESLELTYNTIVDSVNNVSDNCSSVPKVFDCEFNLLDDKTEFDRICKLYNKTRKSMHRDVANLQPKRIFTVNIGKMSERFEVGKKCGNIKELFHGTKSAHILSIMKSGLIIPSDSDSHRTGDMFGRGLYFSDQSTKSLNYATNFWSGGGKSDKKVYMFLADVAMGKEYIPNGPSRNLPKQGYDSTFAIGGKSGVINNEMIVYNINQANLKYLIEFE